MQPIVTANWQASSGNIGTVPFGGGIKRIVRFGNQPVNLSAQFYGNAKNPRFSAPWSMWLQLAVLSPKLTKTQEKEVSEQKFQPERQSHKKRLGFNFARVGHNLKHAEVDVQLYSECKDRSQPAVLFCV